MLAMWFVEIGRILMFLERSLKLLVVLFFLFIITACGKTNSDFDLLLSDGFSDAPVLNQVPPQIIAQGHQLTLDINNIQKGLPGTDENMNYQCTFDSVLDNNVSGETSCLFIPGSNVSFNSASGQLQWLAETALGNYELKISGRNKSGETSVIFSVGVRLNFDGLRNVTSVSGLGATLNWDANPLAQGYQIFSYNPSTGLYELYQSLTGGATTQAVLNQLTPNTGYQMKVHTLDIYGFLDNNTTTKSFTTTELTQFDMHPLSSTLAAGTPLTITVQAYNVDGSPQTVGGLNLTPLIASGTSLGTFSVVTDNNNGTYNFTFTPSTIGTPISVQLTTDISFYLINPVSVTVVPGVPSSVQSTLSLTSNTVTSGQSVNVNAFIKDAYDNPITTGVVAFSASGGSSTGTFSAVSHLGNGYYTATYSGVTAGTSKNITVSINGVALTNTATIQVVPGAPLSANSNFVVSSSTIASGSSVNITATLRDLNNNLVSSGIVVTFDKSGGTSSGNISPTVNAGNGVYTSNYLGVVAGSPQTLSVLIDGVPLAQTQNVQVLYGPVSLANSSLVINQNTVASGNFVTLTATLKDSNNNPLDSNVTISFAKTGGTSTGTFGAVSNQGQGVYNVKYNGVLSGTAQSITVLINAVALATSVAVSVLPGEPDTTNSTISVSSATVTSGNSVTVTMNLKDLNNNNISSGVVVGLSALGGTSSGILSAVSNIGSGVYTATYTGVAAGTNQTLRLLTDGSTLGPSTVIQVVPGLVNLTYSSLVLSQANVNSGQSVTLTATLRDINNNPVSSSSTVNFTKSGGTSTGTYSAVADQGNGVYTTHYTGVLAGTAQSLNVTVNTVSYFPSVSVTVLAGAPSVLTSTISNTNPTIASGAIETITATIKDASGNPISSGIAVTFYKSGGTSTGAFSAVTNFGSGMYGINYQGEMAGSAQTIGVLVDAVALGLTTTLTVTPGAPSALLSNLSLSGNTVTAGQSVIVSLNLVDSFSNSITSGYIVNFDKSGGTSTGSFSATTNQGNGTYTANYTGQVAGTAQTIQATINLLSFGNTQSLQVFVGPPNAAQSSLNVVTSPVASGTVANILAVIRDAYSNPITNEYAITFDNIGGTSTGAISPVTNNGNGSFSATYTGQIAGTAQTLRAFASGVQIAGLTQSVQVIPGSVSSANSVMTVNNPILQSGATTTINLSLRDSNNNSILSGLTLGFSQSAGVSNGTISPITNNGNGTYTATYTGVTQGAAQTVTLVVNTFAIPALNVSVTVTSGAPTQMLLSGPSNPLNSIACNGPYYVDLKDSSNNSTYSATSFSMSLSSVPNSWSGTLFSDSSCTTTLSALNFNIGVATQSFYYKSYVPQSINLTLTPNLGGLAANSITLTNQGVTSWVGAGQIFNFSGSGSTTLQDDSSGFVNPSDSIVDGNYLYVADYVAHKIIKIDLNSNQIVGWLGTIGGLENISSADNSGTCELQAIGSLTTTWCLGGRALQTNSNLLISPRSLAADATYLYVTLPTHRILRFRKDTGSFEGWFGRINSVVGMTPPSCVLAGTGNTTPTWCFGGSSQSGTGDGQMNSPQQIVYLNNYLYVSDYSNHRIQRIHISGSADGWIGQVGATAPVAGGQLASCSPLPTTGNPTPGWCLGGVSQIANRYNLAATPVELIAPNEGFNAPIGLTADNTYLYIGDGNARIVRANIASGALNGYVGNSPNRATPSNNAVPVANTTTRYTTDWSTGGVVTPSSSTTGFHPNIRGMNTDGTYIYFTDDYHRLGRINISNGQGFVQLGRVGSTPTGGVVGCSSTPVGGIAPGWCTGFSTSSIGNTNGAFYNPYSVALNLSNPTILYVADYNNFRIQKFNISTGNFSGWIGSQTYQSSKWNITLGAGVSASRAGISDYATGELGTASIALTGYGNNLFSTDYAFHRIKKFDKTVGSLVGYVGLIGTFPPTGPDDCVGYTSGLTPTWCTGGGRTVTGAGIQAFSNPLGIASDNTYVYIANTGNHRVDRIRISDGLYMGWIGLVLTTPTDGESTCTTTVPGIYTPGWCIGGTATNSTSPLSFSSVRSLSYNADGYLYIQDSHYQIAKVDPLNGNIISLAGNAAAAGVVGCTVSGTVANGWCTSATGPGGTTGYGGTNASNSMTSNSSYIYVMDSSTNRINRYNKSTGAPAGFVGRLTGVTNLNTSGAGGACAGLTVGYPQATPGWCYGNTVGTAVNHSAGNIDNSFSGALGIWADDSHVYVSDTNNNRVVKIDAITGNPLGWRGVIASTAGMTDADCINAGVGSVTPKWCTGGTSVGSRVLGGFDFPTGIWGDSHYVYVYDSRNNRTVTLPR